MKLSNEQIKERLALAEKATKPIPGLEGYFADEDGNIYSAVSRWGGFRKLSLQKNKDGYLKVKLKRDGSLKKTSVHRLVCLTFNGDQPSLAHEVRHLDGTRDNNKASNLRWGTRSENALDRNIHGTSKSAENGRTSSNKLRVAKKTHCKRGHELKPFQTGVRRTCEKCRPFLNRRRKLKAYDEVTK